MIIVAGREVRVDHDAAVWLSQALWMAQGPGRQAAVGLARRIAEGLVAPEATPVAADPDELAQVHAILRRATQERLAPPGLARMADAIEAARSA